MWTRKYDRTKILELLAADVPPKQVAETVGCSESLVRRVAYGDTKARYNYYSDAQLATAKRYHTRMMKLYQGYLREVNEVIQSRGGKKLIDHI